MESDSAIYQFSIITLELLCRLQLPCKSHDMETQATLSTWLSISCRHTHDNLQLLLSHDLEREWDNDTIPTTLKVSFGMVVL